jgi:hypothetical protein
VETANQDYALFVPAANAAVRAMHRTMMIQDYLPSTHKKGQSFTKAVDEVNKHHKHKQGPMQQAIEKTTPAVGLVRDARNEVQSATQAARAAAQDYQSLITRDALKALQKKVEDKEVDEQAIRAFEDKCKIVIGLIHKGMSFIPEVGGIADGALDKLAPTPEDFGNAGDPADRASGPLAQVLHEMEGLQDGMAHLGLLEQSQKAAAIMDRFQKAGDDYAAKWLALKSAIANQRVAYAKVGAGIDEVDAQAGKKGDRGSELMLYMSAVRETNLMVEMGRKEGETAKASLTAAKKGISSHTAFAGGGGYDSRWQDGMGGDPTYEDTPYSVTTPLMKALGLTRGWLKDSKQLGDQLHDLEKDADKALDKFGADGGY